jgi:predicted GTPase
MLVQEGKSLMVAVNKWDLIAEEAWIQISI